MTSAATIAILVVLSTTSAYASASVPAPSPEKSRFLVTAKKVEQSSIASGQTAAAPVGSPARGSTSEAPRVIVELRAACELQSDRAALCNNVATACPEGTTQYRQWQVSADAEIPLNTVCLAPDDPTVAAAPQVTDAMVLEAFRRVPVPALRSVSQPGDRTLVNFDTIFYAEAEPFSRTVTLLGRSVRLDIAPESFRWEFGDGTSATTSTAGAAYPSKDVVHRYQDARTTVRHRVVATWGATWSLDGGPARPVPGTVTTTGPTTALRIAEAVPALSGER